MAETLNLLQVNAETGEQTLRALNANELKAVTAQKAEILARETEANAKVAARASALAKLADLGLTAEEIAAL